MASLRTRSIRSWPAVSENPAFGRMRRARGAAVSSHCLFCRIVERAISSKIVYEDEQVMAFDDINPQAPIHALVIPKRHIGSLDEIQETDRALLGHLLTTCANIAKQKGLARTGY